MKKITYFITGGTGFIGRWLIQELSLQVSGSIGVLMRKPETQEVWLKDWLASHGGNANKIIAIPGDLRKPQLGIHSNDQTKLASVEVIYHLGASMSWGLSAEKAREVNVRPTRDLIQIAQSCATFQRFVLASGFMVTNKNLLARTGLNNYRNWTASDWKRLYRQLGGYEASKFEAHFLALLALEESKLPWTIVHPAAVVGHSQTGEINQYLGLVSVIDQLRQGKMPAIPGSAEDWLPIIPVDFVAQFMAKVILLDHCKQQEYVLLDDRTPDLKTMLQWISAFLGIKPPKVRVPLKLLKFFLKFGLGKLTGVAAESLNFISSDSFETANTKAIASELGLSLPEPKSYLERMVGYLQANQFLQT